VSRLRVVVAAVCAAWVSLALSACGGETGRDDIAFVSSRDGDYAVYVMNADGSHERRLTESDVLTPTTPKDVFFQVEPAWSPDGSKIAFASRRNGTYDIFVMNADGSGSQELTSGKQNDNHPTWSSDGRRIAFARDGDIYVMNADGSDLQRISEVDAEELEPAWSPDGTWIAYVRRYPGGPIKEVWVMHPDGSDRHRLTRSLQEPTTPAWSPDSTRIVFASNPQSGSYQLFTIGVDGRGLKSVVPTVNDNFEPSWSPDGSKIAYQEEGAIFTLELGPDAVDSVEKHTNQANNDSSPVWNPAPAQ
jgi:Tol biopolymer transport system component